MSEREPLLVVDDLRVQFVTNAATVHAVNGVSFTIAAGETVAIVGESGCGKSVTALAVLGVLPRAGRVVGGTVRFGNRDLLRLPEREMRQVRGRDIAMVFQDPMTSMNPVLTVGRQITEPLVAHLGMRQKQADLRAVELLDQVGIAGAKARMREYPHQFSGGMRQRAMIAMALACEPKILIADEPTTALDVTIQAQVLEVLRTRIAERQTALILITHDLGVVAGMCERVSVMYGGMIVEAGSVDTVLRSPRHPYTLGLLGSVPRLDTPRKTELVTIDGSPPNILSEPVACPFVPRCRYAVDRSHLEVPELVELEPGHHVACFNPVPVAVVPRSEPVS